jgi:tetratricopeptide (TPR) repeat protein
MSDEREFGDVGGSRSVSTADLDEKKRRYGNLRDERLGGVSMSRLIDSAKLLDEALQPSFRAPILKAVAEQILGDGRINSDIWEILQRRTQEEGFGQFDSTENFQPYPYYLEECVSYIPSKDEIEKLQPILLREDDSNGLFYLALRYQIWTLSNSDSRYYQLSLACFDQVTRLAPDYTEAWLNKGMILFNLGRYQEALEAFDRAISLRPDFTEVWLNRGMVLSSMERHEEALEVIERAISLDPDNPGAWKKKGTALILLERYEEALEAFDLVLRLGYEWIQRFGPDTFTEGDWYETWYGKGSALNGLGRNDEALEALERATSLGPDYSNAWLNKGVVLQKLGRLDDALEAYSQTLSLEPGYVKAWLNRGMVLSSMERHEEALEAYDRAISLEPDNFEAWYNRGVELGSLEWYEGALEAFDQALTFGPDYAEVWHYWQYKAMALSVLERHEEALEACDRVISLRPDYPEAWLYKGVALEQVGRLDEAVQWLCRAWRARDQLPDDGAFADSILRELGHDPEECR